MRTRAPNARAGGSGVELLPHQRAIRDHLAPGSPHRGLLLYHGLGTGKTCAAWAVAEANAAGMETVVLAPASLARQFVNAAAGCGSGAGAAVEAGRVYCANLNNYSDTLEVAPEDSVVPCVRAWDYLDAAGKGKGKRDGKRETARPRGEKVRVSLHGKLVIVEEAHNLTNEASNAEALSDSSPSRAVRLWLAVYRARGAKVVLLSGTPVVNHVYEAALTMSLLQGPVEVVRFRPPAAAGGAAAGARRAVEFLRETRRASAAAVAEGGGGAGEVVALPAHPGPFVLDSEPRLARGGLGLDAARCELAPDRASGARGAEALAAAVEAGLGARARVVTLDLFPLDKDQFGGEAAEGFAKVVPGKVSFVALGEAERKAQGFPRTVLHPPDECPLTPVQAQRYAEARAAETGRGRARGDDGGVFGRRDGGPEEANYRVLSRMVGNFALQTPLPRGEMAYGPRKEEEAYRQIAELARAGMLAPGGLRDAHSPKMALVLDRIEGGPLPALVYSQFRHTSGVGALARVLDANGWSRARGRATGGDPRRAYAVLGEDPGAVAAYNAGEASVLLVTQSGAEGINLKGTRQVHVLEPFWNRAIIRQVVGRASRKGSHEGLRAADRKVDVYTYLAVAPAGAARGSSGPDRRARDSGGDFAPDDGGLTSDQVIDRVAARKDEANAKILEVMRRNAVDCEESCAPGAAAGGLGAAAHVLESALESGRAPRAGRRGRGSGDAAAEAEAAAAAAHARAMADPRILEEAGIAAPPPPWAWP